MARTLPTSVLVRGLRSLGAFGLNVGLAVGLLLSLAPNGAAETKPGAARSLLLATTTSVQESGLLDALLPGFTKSSGYGVRVIAVGSGAAIEMARKGDADVVIAHSPEAEEALVRDGFATSRTSFMENYFVLVGPKSDPAGIAAAESPEAALGRIFRSRAPFVSRADQSGTHVREQALVKAAGLDPKAPWPGRVETGSGMGPSLLVAGEKRAYILSDVATYLAFRDRVDLVVLSRPSPSLRNVYSILQLDPKRFGHPIESEGAIALERHLLSPEVQRQIEAFGRDRFGEALFVPLRAPTQAVR